MKGTTSREIMAPILRPLDVVQHANYVNFTALVKKCSTTG